MHLRTLSLRNVKCFEAVDLSFLAGSSPRRWTFLVGPNGTGKSTLLKAAATAFATGPTDEIDPRGVRRPDGSWIRLGAGEASVRFSLQFDGTAVPRECEWHAQDREWSVTWKQQPGSAPARGGQGDLLVAVGPMRLASGKRPQPGLPDREDELPGVRARRGSAKALYAFHGDLLAELYSWIRWEDFIRLKEREGSAHRRSVIHRLQAAFDRLFDGMARFRGVDTRGPILFDTADGPVPIDDMADGARSLFVVVAELLLRLDGAFPDSLDPTREEAICIVDELDGHLHPTMQRTVVPALRELFPNVQFVVTTHSPFIVGASLPGEVIVLRRENGSVKTSADVPDVRGWTADAIATSPIFGLDTTRDSTGERALRTEQELSGRDGLSPEQEAALAEARAVLAKADEPIEAMVGRLLAKRRFSAAATARPKRARGSRK